MVKEPGNDRQVRRVEQLLWEDAENYLKELDEPQQHRQRSSASWIAWSVKDSLSRQPREHGGNAPPPPVSDDFPPT